MEAPFVAYRDVQCVYTVSGNYGIALRWSYYILLLFATLFRRHAILTAGAAAYCISYAGATAVHALLLAGIGASSSPYLQDGYVWTNETTGAWVSGRVLDQDVDATFAVVGTGFLTVLPIAVSTSSFRTAGSQPVVMMWAFLMFVGMVGCVVSLYAVNETASGPFLQYRFCLPSLNDTLPMSGNLPPSLESTWNESVWSYFSDPVSISTCFYPCLASSQIMRDQFDITIVSFPALDQEATFSRIYPVLTTAVWTILPLTTVFGTALFLGQSFKLLPDSESPTFSGYPSLWRNLTTSQGSLVYQIIVLFLQIYALVITPILLLILVAFMEWTLAVDPPSETIRHVGQWSPLVGIAFVAIAIFLPWLSKKLRRRATEIA